MQHQRVHTAQTKNTGVSALTYPDTLHATLEPAPHITACVQWTRPRFPREHKHHMRALYSLRGGVWGASKQAPGAAR